MEPKLSIALIIGSLLAGGLIFYQLNADPKTKPSSKPMVDVIVPVLSATAKRGQFLFSTNCAICHGQSADGTLNGPPLVHKIYKPNHHADITFQRAARYGVKAHHWQFGNMPPIPAVKAGDVNLIITYVRALQRANGVF